MSGFNEMLAAYVSTDGKQRKSFTDGTIKGCIRIFGTVYGEFVWPCMYGLTTIQCAMTQHCHQACEFSGLASHPLC